MTVLTLCLCDPVPSSEHLLKNEPPTEQNLSTQGHEVTGPVPKNECFLKFCSFGKLACLSLILALLETQGQGFGSRKLKVCVSGGCTLLLYYRPLKGFPLRFWNLSEILPLSVVDVNGVS